MERVILHSDMNSFYASVELLYRPEYRGKPLVVGGDEEARHGIVLAGNQQAKHYGIKTAMALWEARKCCPDVIIVPPNFERYMQFSKLAKQIYYDYSPQVEAFGLDECWLDLSGSERAIDYGIKIAKDINARIKFELGVTVSIGVSYNKIFAKLGSDMKKPNGITVITKDDFKDKVWCLPVEDLLYVGKATKNKLKKYYIDTIGKLANTEPAFLKRILGINGKMLWRFANGFDDSKVSYENERSQIKSIGNSTTTPKDLISEEQVKATISILSQSVASRLREHKFKCNTVSLSVRDKDLKTYTRQTKLSFPLCTARDIQETAFKLYKDNHNNNIPIRSIGVRASELIDNRIEQTSFDLDIISNYKQEKLERTIDDLSKRFGNKTVRTAAELFDTDLSQFDPKKDNIIHPVSWLQGGTV